jgi:adenylate kinase
MTGRRNCPVCGEIYNIYFKPPKHDNVCDFHPEAQLVHRADDNPETVQGAAGYLRRADAAAARLLQSDRFAARGRWHREPEAIYKDIEDSRRGSVKG